MARRKSSYEPTESEPIGEDPPTTEAGWSHKTATITVDRHMELDGATDWHTVAAEVSASVNSADPSDYKDFQVQSDKVPGISLNDQEMDVAFVALGIEPIEDSMTEEEHDKALEEELGDEDEPEEA